MRKFNICIFACILILAVFQRKHEQSENNISLVLYARHINGKECRVLYWWIYIVPSVLTDFILGIAIFYSNS